MQTMKWIKILFCSLYTLLYCSVVQAKSHTAAPSNIIDKSAQISSLDEVIYDKNIKTFRKRYLSQSERASNEQVLSRPYLTLRNGAVDNSDTDNMIEFSFDELSHEVHQYTVRLRHLNADGTESDLMSSEYVRGFTRYDISDYALSMNTTVSYTHYRFTIPNEDMTLTASGNYAVEVYEDGDEDAIVLRTLLDVVEPKVQIKADIQANTYIELSGRYQQLDVSVSYPTSNRLASSNANMGNDYFIVVRQNGRRDNEVYHPQPSYIKTNSLEWVHNKSLIFEGGNEYRHFDIFSTYFAGYNVDRVVYDQGEYHALLEPDALRGQGSRYAGGMVTDKCGVPYMHEYDNNGQYVVHAERILNDVDIEAEYMWVHWLLPCTTPWFDGSVYVGGDLFGNQFDADNRMLYDADNQCYYLSSLVKQGGYNYLYFFVHQNKATLQRVEGSHWQTENEYAIYVYHRPFGSRYDALVGIFYTSSSE